MASPYTSILSAGIVPRGTQRAVFDQMFWVFTALGTVVGAVVVGYLLWKAYQYRRGASEGDEADEEGVVRPRLGRLPSESHGARHLAVSFSISAIVVLSLIAWTYGALLYLEQGVNHSPPADAGERMNVTVVGHQFYWEFDYHDAPGHDRNVTTRGTLRVPRGALVTLRVTSADVFHNFGIPSQRVKTDAIPGQTTTTWFVADRLGTYRARCYELCGRGHSYMTAKVIVMRPEAFDEWYANRTSANSTGG
ncbi:MAG: cytochrome c oxidase subunit II [Halobacteriaceae archaeon]